MPERLFDVVSGEDVPMSSLRVTTSGHIVRVLAVSAGRVLVQPVDPVRFLDNGQSYQTRPYDIGVLIVP